MCLYIAVWRNRFRLVVCMSGCPTSATNKEFLWNYSQVLFGECDLKYLFLTITLWIAIQSKRKPLECCVYIKIKTNKTADVRIINTQQIIYCWMYLARPFINNRGFVICHKNLCCWYTKAMKYFHYIFHIYLSFWYDCHIHTYL